MGWPKGRNRTVAENKKTSLKLKGRIPWNKGLTKETDVRLAEMGQKVSIANMGHRPYFGMLGKHHSPETIIKIKKSNKGRKHRSPGSFTESHKRNIGIVVRKRFEDPGYLKKIMRRRIPSYPEQIFANLCSEFQYVGNGQLMIDGKNPDFVDLSGTKLVEIWGEYWHIGQNPQDRINFFKARGYDCLIIKASELRYPEQIMAKVREFEER